MKVVLDTGTPSPEFWNEYADLWHNSQYQSSFQSPQFISLLLSRAKGAIMVLKGFREDKLIGASVFHEVGAFWHFLSDMKADHNYFLLSKDISQEESQEYFKTFFEEIRRQKLDFRLNNQPSWASYMPVLVEMIAKSGMYSKTINYNPCMVLQAENPEELIKLTGKQQQRRKMNRLKEQGEVVFEAFHGEEDLECWLEDFFRVHIKKWEGSATPSKYKDIAWREFTSSCIKAWIQEGILVRFSIKIDTKRISFVIALLENGYLVHHSTTYDHDYMKQSPGILTLGLIGKWMAERNMTKIEFGDGGEQYKHEFTNGSFPLLTIFITQPWKLAAISKINLIKFVIEKRALRSRYRTRIKPFLVRIPILKKLVSPQAPTKK